MVLNGMSVPLHIEHVLKMPESRLKGWWGFLCEVICVALHHPCQAIECNLKATIRYGKQGKEKYKMSFNGKITANIQPNGQFLGNYIQWDAPKIETHS